MGLNKYSMSKRETGTHRGYWSTVLDEERDEDLDREREQERFGRNQNAWVTGGHEQ